MHSSRTNAVKSPYYHNLVIKQDTKDAKYQSKNQSQQCHNESWRHMKIKALYRSWYPGIPTRITKLALPIISVTMNPLRIILWNFTNPGCNYYWSCYSILQFIISSYQITEVQDMWLHMTYLYVTTTLSIELKVLLDLFECSDIQGSLLYQGQFFYNSQNKWLVL